MKFTYLVFFCFVVVEAVCQKYTVEKGSASFFSHAAIEDIAAKNEKVAGLFNASTGDVAFSIPITEFQFAKSLMKEHFNENYMESTKYPKAVFKGKIDNPSSVNLSKDGAYEVTVSGQLEIHGVSKPVTTKGTINVKKGAKQ